MIAATAGAAPVLQLYAGSGPTIPSDFRIWIDTPAAAGGFLGDAVFQNSLDAESIALEHIVNDDRIVLGIGRDAFAGLIKAIFQLIEIEHLRENQTVTELSLDLRRGPVHLHLAREDLLLGGLNHGIEGCGHIVTPDAVKQRIGARGLGGSFARHRHDPLGLVVICQRSAAFKKQPQQNDEDRQQQRGHDSEGARVVSKERRKKAPFPCCFFYPPAHPENTVSCRSSRRERRAVKSGAPGFLPR
ncbi:hypothetical protein D3C80_1321590 [compost metagenome]